MSSNIPKSSDADGSLKFDVELIASIAIEAGLRFAIREGGRTVGSDVVSKAVEQSYSPIVNREDRPFGGLSLWWKRIYLLSSA